MTGEMLTSTRLDHSSAKTIALETIQVPLHYEEGVKGIERMNATYFTCLQPMVSFSPNKYNLGDDRIRYVTLKAGSCHAKRRVLSRLYPGMRIVSRFMLRVHFEVTRKALAL